MTLNTLIWTIVIIAFLVVIGLWVNALFNNSPEEERVEDTTLTIPATTTFCHCNEECGKLKENLNACRSELMEWQSIEIPLEIEQTSPTSFNIINRNDFPVEWNPQFEIDMELAAKYMQLELLEKGF